MRKLPIIASLIATFAMQAQAQLVSVKYVPTYSNGVLVQLMLVQRAVADMPLLPGELPGDVVIPAGPVQDLVIEGWSVRVKTAEEKQAEVDAWQNAKPMPLKNADNRLMHWYRTRIPGMETAVQLPDDPVLVAAAYISALYDAGQTSSYMTETTVSKDCRELVVRLREKFGLPANEDASLADVRWHTDAEWQGVTP
jgi:hypothetical protein